MGIAGDDAKAAEISFRVQNQLYRQVLHPRTFPSYFRNILLASGHPLPLSLPHST